MQDSTRVEAPGPAGPVRRLYRDPANRVLGGVAAGIAEHLRVPVIAVRVVFVGLLAANGLGALLYVAFWAVLPAMPGRPASRRRPTRTVLQGAGLVALAAGVLVLQYTAGGFGLDATVVALVALIALGAGIIWHQADPQTAPAVDRRPARGADGRRGAAGHRRGGVRRSRLVPAPPDRRRSADRRRDHRHPRLPVRPWVSRPISARRSPVCSSRCWRWPGSDWPWPRCCTGCSASCGRSGSPASGNRNGPRWPRWCTTRCCTRWP